MEEGSSLMMLEIYRNDRKKLLEFILKSSNLIKQIHSSSGPTPSSSQIDYDTISVDYVIACVNSGGVLDVAEATKSYYHELANPTMIRSQSGNTFFTRSVSSRSGSPPKRQPPSLVVTKKSNLTQSSRHTNQALNDKNKNESRKDNYGLKAGLEMTRSSKASEEERVPVLGLPHIQTGLSDDDLRESAYEVLVASLVFSGIEVICEQDRKKEKSTNILAGLKGKKNREMPQLQSQHRDLEILNTIRTQMEISEAMDLGIRQRLMRFTSRTSRAHFDILQIVLTLLNSFSRSSFQNEKSYTNWKNRQANMLEELCCFGHSTTEYGAIKYSIGKIRNGREWDMMSPTERAEILISVRDSASTLSQRPGNGYHLKVRFYEKLLSSVFDILDEGQILAEADEILKMIKLTWSTLGITQIIHDALYSWVLFKQFVQTDIELLLQNTITQVEKVLPAASLHEGPQSVLCTIEWRGSVLQLNLVPAILLSFRVWCDRRLQDYHKNFRQKSSMFKRVLTFAMVAAVVELNKLGQLTKTDCSAKKASRRIKTYVKSSVQAAYKRVLDCLEYKSNLEGTHQLASLASAVKSIAETELSAFCPVLHKYCSNAGMISSTVLHELFWEQLKPFLQGIPCLSQDVREVLRAARVLDQVLTRLYSFCSEGDSLCGPKNSDLDHFQIGEVSGPLILDWVISQHEYILNWIHRAFELEEWEPLSSQQKHAVSVVEVFRMIEETVDQFFKLKLPVNITHLQALLSIIIHSLDAYLTTVAGQIVEKTQLYPHAPSLTRYEETLVPLSRKKIVEAKILDEKSMDMVNKLTISKLCIRLNTLHYIKNQINVLEDGMRKSWGLVKSNVKCRWFNIVEESPEVVERTMSISEESIDELFGTTFDGIRSSATDAISKIIDFAGTKAVFWDLRETFLFRLYRGGVERARMDSVLPNVDAVLNQICGSVEDNIRDTVILSIFRASLDGYLWVLLDGGPSRAFSDSDITLIEDDLCALKDFFVADGEGLPRSTVERESEFAHQILNLFSLQTSSIVQMLMAASEHIPTTPHSRSNVGRSLHDVDTLIRVLCHKKDREASKFLKTQYQLPPSSDYEENPTTESSSPGAAIISDLLKRSASFRFPESGHNSFKSLKKRFQEAW